MECFLICNVAAAAGRVSWGRCGGTMVSKQEVSSTVLDTQQVLKT